MSRLERQLCRSGLLLFLIGLPLGFAVHAMPNARAGLSAHLNAVQSGTALLALGLLWPRLRLPARWAALLAHTLSLSFWGLEAMLVAAAFVRAPGATVSPSWWARTAGVVGGVSAVLMLLGVAAVCPAFRERGAESERGASAPSIA